MRKLLLVGCSYYADAFPRFYAQAVDFFGVWKVPYSPLEIVLCVLTKEYRLWKMKHDEMESKASKEKISMGMREILTHLRVCVLVDL